MYQTFKIQLLYLFFQFYKKMTGLSRKLQIIISPSLFSTPDGSSIHSVQKRLPSGCSFTLLRPKGRHKVSILLSFCLYSIRLYALPSE